MRLFVIIFVQCDCRTPKKMIQQSLVVFDTRSVRIRCVRMDFLWPKIRNVLMSTFSLDGHVMTTVEVSDEANQILSLNSKQTEDEQGNGLFSSTTLRQVPFDLCLSRTVEFREFHWFGIRTSFNENPGTIGSFNFVAETQPNNPNSRNLEVSNLPKEANDYN